MNIEQNQRVDINVYVISDATGIPVEWVIQSVLLQFKQKVEPIIIRHGHVKTINQLQRIMAEAEAAGGIVIFSLMSRKLNEWMARHQRRANVEMIDLLGPIIERMAKLFSMTPEVRPRAYGILGEHSLRLAESIDYTLRHDDGAGIETLGQANLILLGVSRTSKTPTSLYLSCNFNLKVANVPIVPGVPPPKKLFTLKRPMKVGFVIDADKLAAIRRRRYKNTPVDSYCNVRSIRDELAYCDRVYDKIDGLRLVDVTNRSIEEVAAQIMQNE